MAFTHAERVRLRSRLLSDDDSGDRNSGKIGSDGRIKVQAHHSAQSVVDWFKNSQFPEPEKPSRKREFCPASFSGQRPTTSPRLNIAIHVVGSRGDVQPFIPIAQTLSKPPYSHRVRICTHPVFKEFVEEYGIEFFSIGGDPSALMAYIVRNPSLIPSRESIRAGDIGKRREEMWEIMNGAWRSCITAGNGLGQLTRAVDVLDVQDLFIADAIIANPPSMAHIHCAEKLSIPLHMVFTMPWSPTIKFPHPLASVKEDGVTESRFINYFSFLVMELLTWQGLGDLINKFRLQILRLDPISPLWGHQLLPRLHVPFSYLWSQTLIPKPTDWGSHINITGFSFLQLSKSYIPSPGLREFLNVPGPSPIYIGFGSIIIDDPQALTDIILRAVKLAGVRAIVSKGWGGIGTGEIPKNIYLIDNIPHDWLFQHVSVVVHHGGAGTTAAGIAAGCPSVIIPFFGDQLFWGQMISRAGAGPTPIPFRNLTAEKLVASIRFALQPEVRTAVQKMADCIASENGAYRTAADFQERYGIDQMRCDLCSERLAVWEHKRTGAHLSAFATSCLIREELIEPAELKPLRHRHWYVDEGAEHPIVGVIAAGSLLLACLANAGRDYTTRLRNRPRSSHKFKNATSIIGQGPNRANLPSLSHNQMSPFTKADECNGRPDDMGSILTRAKSNHGLQSSGNPPTRLTQAQMENIAHRVANKSLKSREKLASQLERDSTFHERGKAMWQAQERGRHGKAFYLIRATGRFAADITEASIRAPVALFYNIANGFHNYLSYRSPLVEIRRRNEITGLGSGLETAGKEFVLGFYDALSGIAVQPYKGFKKEGRRGLGKGVLNGGVGFVYNIGAAVFGLPGYALKGCEKEYQKHHLIKLRAELLLIRMRQAMQEYELAAQKEKDAVVERWKSAVPECST